MKISREKLLYEAEVENIIKVLDIFRVFYNYVGVGEDGKTPARFERLWR